MPLVYLPDVESLFVWDPESAPRGLAGLNHGGEPWSTKLVVPEGLREVAGLKLPLFDTMGKLAIIPAAEIESLSGSVATWVLATKTRGRSRSSGANGADHHSALHFRFDESVTHGAVLRQLGAPIAWESEASPADVLAPLVRAAAETARRIAMTEPSETDEGAAGDGCPPKATRKSRGGST